MQFANRVSRTFDFELSYGEKVLYAQVNHFLRKDYLYSLPTANRNLLTLVIRKLLASSSFALIETFEVILERLQKEQRVLVAELSQEYSVTEETIRRDLDKLEKEGFVKIYKSLLLRYSFLKKAFAFFKNYLITSLYKY